MNTLLLHTGSLNLTFNRDTGALVGMVAPATGWVIHRRAALGDTWRLLVPVSDTLRSNYVFGSKQKSPAVEFGDGFVRFTWDGVESERAGRLAIRVVQEFRAEGPQAVCRTRIENNSPYPVESVYAPCIGDLSHPEGCANFQTLSMGYCSGWETGIWPVFHNHQGDYGEEIPTQTYGGNTPTCPFVLLHTDKEGLYVGVKDGRGESVAWFSELHPGYDSAIDSRVPQAEEIAGKPVHVIFMPVHSPYLQPGCSEDLTPITFEAYQGDWQHGLDIYSAWRSTWSGEAQPAAQWARDPHSWLQLHINSPEDELRMRFTDLPKVAAECAKLGVKAIQLVGWNDGGQDQGNPSHTPDPRLGTYDELKAAIAECQAMDVQIILFSKFTWADRAEKWYREELHKYAVKDVYGDAMFHQGYKYFTPAQYLDHNVKRFAPMCFASKEYLAICQREFEKVAGLGCAGFLYDECQHHGPAQLCFDTSHGHKYGWPVHQNDNALIEMFRKTPGLRPDFLFAGEACHDWEFAQYNLAYFRSRDKWHKPVQRYLRPHAQIMTAISGFNDRNMVDQCLMYRYVMSYEPFNFHGWLHDFPETVAYGRKMDALRTELRAWLWDGTYRGTCGASVVLAADGAPHHPFSRFEAADGTSALVVCNYEDKPVAVKAALDSGAAPTKYRAVEDAGWTPIPADGAIPVAGRSAVVVM